MPETRFFGTVLRWLCSVKKPRETKERLEVEGEGQEGGLGVTPLTHFVFLLVVCEAIHRTGPDWGRADSSSSNAARGRSSEPLHIFYPCRLGCEPAATRMLLHPPAQFAPIAHPPADMPGTARLPGGWHKRPGVGRLAGRWHEAYDGAAAGPQDGRRGLLL